MPWGVKTIYLFLLMPIPSHFETSLDVIGRHFNLERFCRSADDINTPLYIDMEYSLYRWEKFWHMDFFLSAFIVKCRLLLLKYIQQKAILMLFKLTGPTALKCEIQPLKDLWKRAACHPRE